MFDDGDFTIAKAQGGKTKVFPFEGDAASFYTEQEFMQAYASFTPRALNSQDPEDAQSFLVKESELTPIGGGLVTWRRTYSRIPAQRNDKETITYTFPGYAAITSSQYTTPWGLVITTLLPFVTDPGRAPQARKVVCRIQYDYFLVGTNGIASVDLIPIIPAQRYLYGSAWTDKDGQDIPDRLLYQASLANFSNPTVEQWKSKITAGTEIVAEDSEIHRWRGNIYERITRYIKAQ